MTVVKDFNMDVYDNRERTKWKVSHRRSSCPCITGTNPRFSLGKSVSVCITVFICRFH